MVSEYLIGKDMEGSGFSLNLSLSLQHLLWGQVKTTKFVSVISVLSDIFSPLEVIGITA